MVKQCQWKEDGHKCAGILVDDEYIICADTGAKIDIECVKYADEETFKVFDSWVDFTESITE